MEFLNRGIHIFCPAGALLTTYMHEDVYAYDIDWGNTSLLDWGNTSLLEPGSTP